MEDRNLRADILHRDLLYPVCHKRCVWLCISQFGCQLRKPWRTCLILKICPCLFKRSNVLNIKLEPLYFLIRKETLSMPTVSYIASVPECILSIRFLVFLSTGNEELWVIPWSIFPLWTVIYLKFIMCYYIMEMSSNVRQPGATVIQVINSNNS